MNASQTKPSESGVFRYYFKYLSCKDVENAKYIHILRDPMKSLIRKY